MANRDWLEKDFYRELGVGKDASQDEIKKAYRKIARENHPDTKPGDEKAEARFKAAGEAYGVLSDPTKRSEYDEARSLFAGGRFGGFGEAAAASAAAVPAPARPAASTSTTCSAAQAAAGAGAAASVTCSAASSAAWAVPAAPRPTPPAAWAAPGAWAAASAAPPDGAAVPTSRPRSASTSPRP